MHGRRCFNKKKRDLQGDSRSKANKSIKKSRSIRVFPGIVSRSKADNLFGRWCLQDSFERLEMRMMHSLENRKSETRHSVWELISQMDIQDSPEFFVQEINFSDGQESWLWNIMSELKTIVDSPTLVCECQCILCVCVTFVMHTGIHEEYTGRILSNSFSKKTDLLSSTWLTMDFASKAFPFSLFGILT